MSPVRPVERALTGTGMAPRVPVRAWRPYRWNRQPGWTPESAGPIAPAGPDRAARMAQFNRHRAAGIPVWRSAQLIEVSHTTGSAYERKRLQALRQEREAGDAA